MEYERAEIVRERGVYYAHVEYRSFRQANYRWSAGEAGDESTFQVERSEFA